MNSKHANSTAIAQQAAAGATYDPQAHGMITSPNWCVFQAVKARLAGANVVEAWNGRGYSVNVKTPSGHYILTPDRDLKTWSISAR